MVHEALASIRIPLQIGSLSITNGHVAYCESWLLEPTRLLTIGA